MSIPQKSTVSGCFILLNLVLPPQPSNSSKYAHWTEWKVLNFQPMIQKSPPPKHIKLLIYHIQFHLMDNKKKNHRNLKLEEVSNYLVINLNNMSFTIIVQDLIWFITHSGNVNLLINHFHWGLSLVNQMP